MEDIDLIETKRLEAQKRLESKKSQLERNKLGQFATPTALATDILKYAKSLIPPTSKIRFIDPAFGTGSFYSALLQTFPSSRISNAVGYEIDSDYGIEANKIWSNTSLKLNISDFTREILPPDHAKVNLLICNPPYVRHHHLPKKEKPRLQKLAEEISGVKINGLSGLYCYFLLISHGWMAENGLAGWLIPSEFMDVKYGKQIKEYLLNRVTLLRIHRFDPNEAQFEDALVSSAVVWFRKSTPPRNSVVEFTYGGGLLNPRVSKLIPVASLRRADKWTRFPLAPDINKSPYKNTKLSDLFIIKRGLATGANKFFILTSNKVSKYQIPSKFLKPILPSPRHLSVDEIEANSKGNPRIDKKLFLLTCNLPEDVVKTRYPSLWKYLQSGVKDGVNERYLCRHRSPWYSQEERDPPPLLCTYMGRHGGRNSSLFRFILNHSKAIAANSYLLMYPKPALDKKIKNNPRILKVVWRAINGISTDKLVDEGRVYGGGLHKIEPKELGNVPSDSILKILPKV